MSGLEFLILCLGKGVVDFQNYFESSCIPQIVMTDLERVKSLKDFYEKVGISYGWRYY